MNISDIKSYVRSQSSLMDMHVNRQLLDMLDNLTRTEIKTALSKLAHNERRAVDIIFANRVIEQTISAKDICEAHGFTRSMVVEALDKLKAAGVIDARSRGRKGTFVFVKVPELFDILESLE